MADFDVRAFDNDGANHANDFDPVTDEGWFVPADFGALGAAYPFFLKHYNSDESAEIGATGTGLFNPFLNMNGDSTLVGFNTSANVTNTINTANGTDISDPNTDAIQLGDIPIIYRDLDGDGTAEAYYLINLDINENVNSEVSLEELQLFTSSSAATFADYHFDEGASLAFANNGGDPATDFTLRFDLDATGDNKLIMRDDGAGQGKLDYTFYLPVGMFAGASPNDYLTLFSQFGPNPADDAGFAEWNVLTAAKISGIKFKDVNGDGTRDENGADNILGNFDDEVPLAGFTMYIDLNDNNKLDANEQTALTDSNGAFTFASLLPNETYIVREVLTAADVNGPLDAGTDVNFATYAPPAGAWDQTTDDGTGDQVVNVTTGTTNILVGNRLQVPNFTIDKLIVSVVDGVELQGGDPNTTADDAVDEAGDQINYRVVITNTGDLALSLTSISDTLEGAGVTVSAASFTESGTDNNILDLGETWTWNWTETVSQAELDVLCADDELITNTVTATFNYNGTPIGPKTDFVNTTVVCDPDFTAVKSIVSVDGGVELLGGDPLTTADDAVDSVGDQINYRIVITNTGNVTLDGESITDTFEGAASGLTAVDFTETGGTGTNGDGILDVGETWTHNFTETVSQVELDALCADDELITNTLAASFSFDGETLGPKGNTVNTSVVCNPTVELIKYVDVGFGFDDANTGPGPLNVNVGGDVDFKITLENTGNISLTAVDITDTYLSAGAPGTPNLLVDNGVLTAYALAHGAVLTGDDDDGIAGNGFNADGILQVGETWTITYTEAFDPLSFDPGEHLNTADVTTDEGATDEDSAYYYSLISADGPGVRTPGFWQNPNNGGQFWNGAIDAKHDGDPCFPVDDLLRIDSDKDGDIDANDTGYSNKDGVLGLYIGDYDRDGVAEGDEDVIFISRDDAMNLLSSNTKDMNDMAVKIGRDVVATWLNYLAGNEIGEDPDALLYSPKEAINDAVDYLQTYAGKLNNPGDEIFDCYKPNHSAVTNKNKPEEFASGTPIHNALDEYNNFGTINDHPWAHDCDDLAFVTALTVYHSSHSDLLV